MSSLVHDTQISFLCDENVRLLSFAIAVRTRSFSIYSYGKKLIFFIFYFYFNPEILKSSFNDLAVDIWGAF